MAVLLNLKEHMMNNMASYKTRIYSPEKAFAPLDNDKRCVSPLIDIEEVITKLIHNLAEV